MIRDIYLGALAGARSMRAQYADAQDAAQETVLRALRAGREVSRPKAYGRTIARRILLELRPETIELPSILADRSIDVSQLREALARSGADRWPKARKEERARIRARLVREGWEL